MLLVDPLHQGQTALGHRPVNDHQIRLVLGHGRRYGIAGVHRCHRRDAQTLKHQHKTAPDQRVTVGDDGALARGGACVSAARRCLAAATGLRGVR